MTSCPICGRQDTVRRVKELVSFGFVPPDSQPDGQPDAPAKEGVDAAAVHAANMALAERLFVPDDVYLEQEKKDVTERLGKGGRPNRTFSIVLAALVGFLVVNQFAPGWAWLGLIVGMLLGGLFFNYLPNRVIKKVRTEARMRREKALRRYAALYYCTQDDLVFLPGEGLSAPVGEMVDLLYQP